MTTECTHVDDCELYTQFAMNPALQIWQKHYCKADYTRCVRFQLALRKESVPLNLLPNGTRVDAPRSAKDFTATALFTAVLKSRMPMIEYLLRNGTDINVRNSDGMTPLMAAASTGDLNVLRLLLTKGANAAAVNNSGETAGDVATRSGHADAAKLLQSVRAAVASAPAAAASSRGGWLSRLR